MIIYRHCEENEFSNLYTNEKDYYISIQDATEVVVKESNVPHPNFTIMKAYVKNVLWEDWDVVKMCSVERDVIYYMNKYNIDRVEIDTDRSDIYINTKDAIIWATRSNAPGVIHNHFIVRVAHKLYGNTQGVMTEEHELYNLVDIIWEMYELGEDEEQEVEINE